MNAVEIEEAVSALALQPFDRAEFPFAFLAAFGNKETTIQRLRAGSTNTSDIPGGVLQRSNIHIATCDTSKVGETLTALRASPRTSKGKVKFVLATDGVDFEAEELASGEVTGLQKLSNLANHFGFFLPLAGISTVAEIKNNPIDIKATSRLNKLYVELWKENPDWATAERRPALNQFLVRLIFCFFAEDTGIFDSTGLFSICLQQMTAADSSNTHEVIAELFRAMNTPTLHNNVPDPRYRDAANIKSWARPFPYVNGKLFSGSTECPRFSKIARSYLIRAGELDWKQINPDIFGSMIQAVADDDERGELGMHYTSVPNILKVLDPLFLDDLREELEKAEDNPRKLLNLRKRIAKIHVLDPACGSGNFLVIAYIRMREIEAEIVRRRGEQGDMFAQKSWIELTNFFGIEIKSFAAEVARLSLLIAEFQCNVRLIGQREACLDVLPLHDTGRITTDNALRLDWHIACPNHQLPSSEESPPTDPQRPEIVICGNPPYLGGKAQTPAQKADLSMAFANAARIGELDYVTGWLIKASQFIASTGAKAAFVSTSSINQGSQVHQLWPKIFSHSVAIEFAHSPFKWANNAKANAAVICVIIGLARRSSSKKRLFENGLERRVDLIGPYLAPGSDVIVQQALHPLSSLPAAITGNSPYDGGQLILDVGERAELLENHTEALLLIRRLYGSHDYINGIQRYCLWITEDNLDLAASVPQVAGRIHQVRTLRSNGGEVAKGLANVPHRFRYTHTAERRTIIIPRHTSERRHYLPFGLLDARSIISDSAQAIYDPNPWVFALLESKLHLCWVRAVGGRIKTDIRYLSGLCYNTFPLPPLTTNQQADLTRCAEDILLAREHYFPATIADMYDPERMDKEFPLVRQAHEKNDETLERIYIGRSFKNDTERLEKLFDMYTKMTAAEAKSPKKNGRKSKSTDDSPAA